MQNYASLHTIQANPKIQHQKHFKNFVKETQKIERASEGPTLAKKFQQDKNKLQNFKKQICLETLQHLRQI